MNGELTVYNSLSRKKEQFIPLHPQKVGMYVCGPTVYGDPHLGHARPAITFDIVFRYLKHLGYSVRYVRNITDVGHLEDDSDDGEDKIAKKARLEQLEPMEIAQYYTNRYATFMQYLNILPPSIEPRASGHIIEQIELIEKIFQAGFAYEANGSVYFDNKKYSEHYQYGILSGRKIEDMLCNTRELDGQDEKNCPADFALWKKATPEHIMKWNSPWSNGFPGWHLECSAMGLKYLGTQFDIHGGGMDLLFPHHESEIAQCMTGIGNTPAKYWLHNNMITINGQKMGKSLGNFITLEEFFTGSHTLLEQVYSPMTIRFFILQAHYRSTLDFSNHALQSAEKGLQRLTDAYYVLQNIKSADKPSIHRQTIEKLKNTAYAALNDDFNTPIVIAQFFEACKLINHVENTSTHFNSEDIEMLTSFFHIFFEDILGLKLQMLERTSSNDILQDIMRIILDFRQQMKTEKKYEMSDYIRKRLEDIGVQIKDTKDGTVWEKK